MASTTNIIDVLVGTQSKVVENLLDTSKKLQEAFGQADAMDKTKDIFSQWMETQKSIFEEMTGSVKDQFKVEDLPMPEMMKNFVESQKQFAENMFSSVKDLTKNYSTTSALQTYQEQTDKLYDTWKDAHNSLMDRLGKPFSDMEYNPAAFAQEMNHKFVDTAKGYIEMFAKEGEVVAEKAAPAPKKKAPAKKATDAK